MSVGSHIVDIIVVEMRVLQIISAWVALVEVVEIVVVDGGLCDEILGPSDAEGFVVVAENGVGYSEEVCVFPAVDEAVAGPF